MKRMALVLSLLLASICSADYLGSWKIDDYVCVTVAAHQFSTGASYAATGDVLLDIYEDATATEIVNDTAMAQFDSRTGLYQARVQLTAAAGFEKGKHYTCVIAATVDGVSALALRNFQIQAEVDAETVSDKTGYGLADDAITASKYDESTAYPVTGAALNVSSLATTTDQGDIFDARLAVYDPPTKAEMDALIGTPAGASLAADIADIPTVTEFNARTQVTANYFDPTTDTVLVGDKTGFALTSETLALIRVEINEAMDANIPVGFEDVVIADGNVPTDSTLSLTAEDLTAIANAVHTSVVSGTLTYQGAAKVLMAAFLGKTASVDNGSTHTTTYYDPADGVTAIFTITSTDADGSRAAGGTVH